MMKMVNGQSGGMLDCACDPAILDAMEAGEKAEKDSGGKMEDKKCDEIPQAVKDSYVDMVNKLDANAMCAGMKKNVMCSMSEEQEKCLTDAVAAKAAASDDTAA